MPVLNNNEPLEPTVTALALRTTTLPLLLYTARPLTISMLPPVAAVSYVGPAFNDKMPPIPESPEPTAMLIEPPRPPPAEPLTNNSCPVLPAAAVPELSKTLPDIPTVAAFKDEM